MTKKKGSDESMPHTYSGMPLRGAVYQETDYPDLDEEEWAKCGGTP